MNQYANDFTTTVISYYNDLKRCKPLSKGKERKLLKLCKHGNVKARQMLLESNLRFVFNIAKHYSGKGVPIDELISDGNIGLLRAIEKFDYERDIRFISYAVWWIRQAMIEAIKRRHTMNYVQLESDCDIGDMIGGQNYYEEEIEIHNPSSSCQLSSITNDNEEDKVHERKRVLDEMMEVLTDRERDVIESYFGINDGHEMTLLEIGKKYNITSERVRQIKATAVRKLRTQLLLQDDIEYIL